MCFLVSYLLAQIAFFHPLSSVDVSVRWHQWWSRLHYGEYRHTTYRTKKMSYNLSNHVFEQKQTMLIWLGSIIKSWSRLGVSFGNQPRHFSSD